MTMLEPFGYLNPTGRSPAFHFLKRDNEDGMPVFTADQMLEYGAACAAAERERIAAWLDAEHETRKHLDNYAAFYARAIRQETP